MKKIKIILALATLAFGYNTANAQAAALSSQQKGYLINTWYESPKESRGDTIVFRTSPYVLTAADDPAFAFSKLTFGSTSAFSVSYWRSCTTPAANSGTWSYTSGSTATLDFGAQRCKNKLTFVDVKADKLEVIIKE